MLDNKVDVALIDPEIITHTAPRTEKVLLDTLRVDHSYQRGLKHSRHKIVKRWNPDSAGVVIVGRRSNGRNDDGDYIIDGQQRVWAMLKMGIDRWDAWVIKSSGPEFEAVIFRQYNSGEGRTQLTATDIYRSALRANDVVALALKEAVERLGFKIGEMRQSPRLGAASNRLVWPNIWAIGTIYNAARSHGVGVVERVLRVLKEAWEPDPEALREVILKGMIRLMVVHGDKVRDDRLVMALKRLQAVQVCREVKLYSGQQSENFMRIVLAQYNKKVRGQYKINAFE